MQNTPASIKANPLTGPADFSNKFNTPIPKEREEEFENWITSLPLNLRNQNDYDLQGAFLDGVKPSESGHFPDTFKKPNHPTFSDQSKYHGKEGNIGGHWDNKTMTFEASPTNLQFTPPDVLIRVFKNQNPDWNIILQK